MVEGTNASHILLTAKKNMFESAVAYHGLKILQKKISSHMLHGNLIFITTVYANNIISEKGRKCLRCETKIQ